VNSAACLAGIDLALRRNGQGDPYYDRAGARPGSAGPTNTIAGSLGNLARWRSDHRLVKPGRLSLSSRRVRADLHHVQSLMLDQSVKPTLNPRLYATVLSVDEIDHSIFFEFVDCRSLRQPGHPFKITDDKCALLPYRSNQIIRHGGTPSNRSIVAVGGVLPKLAIANNGRVFTLSINFGAGAEGKLFGVVGSNSSESCSGRAPHGSPSY
jgi:hypothetical protein